MLDWFNLLMTFNDNGVANGNCFYIGNYNGKLLLMTMGLHLFTLGAKLFLIYTLHRLVYRRDQTFADAIVIFA